MSRNEEIMQAIINGQQMPGNPKSRNEALLQGIGEVINEVKSDLTNQRITTSGKNVYIKGSNKNIGKCKVSFASNPNTSLYILRNNMIYFPDVEPYELNGLIIGIKDGIISVKGSPTATTYISFVTCAVKKAWDMNTTSMLKKYVKMKMWLISGTAKNISFYSGMKLNGQGYISSVTLNGVKELSGYVSEIVGNANININATNNSDIDLKFALSVEIIDDAKSTPLNMYTGMSEYKNAEFEEITVNADNYSNIEIDNSKYDTYLYNVANAVMDVAYDFRSNDKTSRKVCAVIGDSIACGVGWAERKGYAYLLKERHPDMIIKNYAIGGATLTYSNDTNNISKQLATLLASNETLDLVILQIGVNDSWGSKAIGDLETSYTSTFDTTNMMGCFETVISTIRNTYPNCKIMFITTHKISSAANLGTYVDAIVNGCKKWSVYVCDMYNSGLNTYISVISDKYTWGGSEADGVHPNELGYREYYISPVDDGVVKLIG